MANILDFGVGFFKERTFNYSGNVLIALSGGRSSAATLRLLLDQYGGALPSNFQVVFTNTAKEHPSTYDFLIKIRDIWKVNIICLELAGIINDRKVEYRKVSLEETARNGEPWWHLVAAKPTFPPRRANRLCTVYLKILPVISYATEELQWGSYTQIYGYRSDENHRLNNALIRCGKSKLPFTPSAPLIAAGIDKPAVLAFFEQAEFNLDIPDYCGNCNHCLLKGEMKQRKIMQAMPGAIDWWIELEQEWGKFTTNSKYPRQYNILPNGGYQGVKDRALATLPPATPDDDIEDLECNCTD